MWELFVVGTFPFWCLVLVEFVALLLCMEYESGILATVSIVAFGLALHFMGGVNILSLIVANWLLLLPFILGYLGFAVAWGIAKWVMYYKDCLDAYSEARYNWLKEEGVANPNEMPPTLKKDWTKWLEHNKIYNGKLGRHINLAETPQARENKARIMRWMAYWPISFLLWIGRDMVVQIFKRIYGALSRYLQHMADQAFAKVRDDLVVEADTAEEPLDGGYRNRR